MKIICQEIENHEESVGNLVYGAVVTNVTGHPNCTYMKVDKHHLGACLKLTFPSDCTVLLNLKTGALRQVKGSTLVTVLDATLTVRKTSAKEYLKEWLKDGEEQC